MNLRQVVQPRSSSNGYGRRRVEKESATRLESKLQHGKSDTRRVISAGELSRGGEHGNSSRDRLVYVTACLIGQYVEVQVTNGSIFSGIFHAINAEKDFGIILKMSHLIKRGSLRGQETILEPVSEAPSRILIIPANELVQVTAKDVCLTADAFGELQRKQQQEILIDSCISQSRQVDPERELERWVPDEDDPHCPELENVFDDPWDRKWDQFQTNETLFGVKSTFNEEIYTTKLERGPQTKDLEREASRIAKEIEGEETHDSHLAEERGFQNHEDFDADEEARYSSVARGVDNSGYNENGESCIDSCSNETFGGSSSSATNRSPTDTRSGSQVSSSSSSKSLAQDETRSPQLSSSKNLHCSDSNDHARQSASELMLKNSSTLDSESRIQDNEPCGKYESDSFAKNTGEKQTSAEEVQLSNMEATRTTNGVPSSGNSHGQHGSSASSSSDNVGTASASSGPSLSPSSSIGSLSSEKSSLNPYAKEFKLNPHARCFVPEIRPPPPPVSNTSLYMQADVPTIMHNPGMPFAFGMGPPYVAHQPVVLNPQGGASMHIPQAYYHPNGPQYVQQMIAGHPRSGMYMSGYPPDMQYK